MRKLHFDIFDELTSDDIIVKEESLKEPEFFHIKFYARVRHIDKDWLLSELKRHIRLLDRKASVIYNDLIEAFFWRSEVGFARPLEVIKLLRNLGNHFYKFEIKDAHQTYNIARLNDFNRMTMDVKFAFDLHKVLDIMCGYQRLDLFPIIFKSARLERQIINYIIDTMFLCFATDNRNYSTWYPHSVNLKGKTLNPECFLDLDVRHGFINSDYTKISASGTVYPLDEIKNKPIEEVFYYESSGPNQEKVLIFIFWLGYSETYGGFIGARARRRCVFKEYPNTIEHFKHIVNL